MRRSTFISLAGLLSICFAAYASNYIPGLKTNNLNITSATSSRAAVFDSSSNLTSSVITSTELGYLSGATSSIQSQLNTINALAAAAIAKTIGTTKGDMIGFSAASTPVRHGVGADGTTIVADSAQTDGWKWATPSVTTVTGTLPIGNGGTGQTSKTLAFDALSPTSSAGDIAVFGATNNVRFPTGNDGYVLMADSTQTVGLKWASLPGGGAKNYLGTVNGTNNGGDFETGSVGSWVLGTATLTSAFPSGAPTFGSGASGNLSLTATSSGKLAGSYSASYASSAATTAGNFLASPAFTIDTEDQGKVLAIKFYYQGKTNPTNANWSGTSSNSFGVAIYDVTNSAWVMPAGVWGMTQNSGIGYFVGTFQTASNGSQYRLVVFNANATSGAVTNYYDDFFVGPQIAPIGAVVTDWQSFTPTGAWSSNTTYTGRWRRVGDSMEIQYELAMSGAPTAANLTINLPSGYSIDTTKFADASLTTESYFDSNGGILKSGTSSYPDIKARYISSTSVGVIVLNSSTGVGALVSNTVPVTFASGDKIWLHVRLPISGWSSTTQMSNDTDTRVVAMGAYSQTPTGTLSAAANVVKFTASSDTHSAYSSSTGLYTVPVTGWYSISATLDISRASVAVGNATGVYLYKNGTGGTLVSSNFTKAAVTGVTNYLVTATGMVYCNAGDTLGAYSYADPTTPAFETSLGGSSLSISRLSGPAVVAATESVNAAYDSTSGPTINNTTPTIAFTTKEFDSHNAYNTSTGAYTVPVTGKYQVSVSVLSASAAYTSGQSIWVAVYQAGSASTSKMLGLYRVTANVTAQYGISGSQVFNCLAGDTLTVKVFSDTSTTLATGSAPYNNSLSITRVGN